MNFNVIEDKNFIVMVYSFSLQLTFKKIPLVKLWFHIEEEYPHVPEKAIEYFSLSQQQICGRPAFLHVVQPKQHITKD